MVGIDASMNGMLFSVHATVGSHGGFTAM